MGSLSRKYESSGDPGTIANNKGDIGGASYGTYQIASNTGTMNNFLSFAKNMGSAAANILTGKPGTTEFNQAWKSLAAKDPEGFGNLQHEFIKTSHFEPAVQQVAKSTGLNAQGRSQALQDVLWSTAVQHGPAGAANVFRNAIGSNANLSDAEIIKRVYAERLADGGKKYFGSSSASVRQSVVNRFNNELKDALSMLG